MSLTAVLAIGWFGYTRLSYRVPERPGADGVQSAAPLETTSPFRCEGKTRCSQMVSCEEARFYLRNCPGVKIDGDGVPCETQHCL